MPCATLLTLLSTSLAGGMAFAPPGVARAPPSVARSAVARCAEAAPVADDEELTPADLKAELLDLLAELPSRGLNAPEEDVEDVLEIIEELEPFNPWPEFARSPAFGGTWRLLYTTSRIFHTNMGLMAYSRDVDGVETPELLMKVQTDYRLVTFEEPITYVGTSVASFMGGLMNADVLRAECSWRPTANGIFAGRRTTRRAHDGPRQLTAAPCVSRQSTRSGSRRASARGCPPTDRPRASAR